MRRDRSVPRIICLGDSLTVGYQSPTPDFPMLQETPYGEFLQEHLGPQVCVVVSGVCGELTGEMAMRFRQDVLAQAPTSVVILGGTNDLGWSAAPAEIMRNLLKMYETALAANIRLVAVTVPSIRVGEGPEGTFPTSARVEWGQEDVSPTPASVAGDVNVRPMRDEHIVRRQELNRLISNYCAKKGVPCVDFFAATAEPDTLRLAAVYSNDGLHLTTEGYRKLAKLLYEQVFAGWFGSLRQPGL